ncbi:hypothetical protein SAMN06265182_0773 [Persephonella hydrogeniphila]|uniref:Uncharacterized protein n=1 Tax=Persephonella hydrogeniphila TaxID=198703 RepID=A0A285NCP9_9AQUI|nr:hypothetical protein [Persephonella hydrogeniphila]SNZ06717.1 hypothetical protein SAMN06265182_0773 [Persephonella hydrogeniphila]
MWRIIKILLIIYTIGAWAFQGEEAKKIESAILSEVSSVITGKQYGIKVYTTDNMKYIFRYSKILLPVYECINADLIIAGERLKDNRCRGKKMIVTRYYLLKEYKNAIAAFYWHKGRPNLIFIQERLKHYGISIPDKYKKFADSEKNL